jgi:hypothetical protein
MACASKRIEVQNFSRDLPIAFSCLIHSIQCLFSNGDLFGPDAELVASTGETAPVTSLSPTGANDGEMSSMMDLDQLKRDRAIVDVIDWEMTPEKAVEAYLEWGTGWSRKGDAVVYPSQESLYFVIYAWETPAQVTLIRRNVREAVEIAKIEVPADMVNRAIDEAGRKPGVGVYALSTELTQWMKAALGC